jgi:DNA polymerase-3 subunit epsilon
MKLFIDTETTGVYDFRAAPTAKFQPRIVQVAALLIDDERQERAMFHTLISPRRGGDGKLEWEVPVGAFQVHGISTDDCVRFGIRLPIVLDTLMNMMEAVELVVAHNVDFDVAMLVSEFCREMRETPLALRRKRFCTMKESTEIVGLPGRFSSCKWPKLSEAYQFFFQEELQGAHDALADVRACARIFFALQDRAAVEAP